MRMLPHFSDVMCGQLFCSSTPSLVNFVSLYLFTATAHCYGYTCNSVMIDTGTQQQSPSYVPNGAQCGTGKVRSNTNNGCFSSASKLMNKFMSDLSNRYPTGSWHRQTRSAGVATASRRPSVYNVIRSRH